MKNSFLAFYAGTLQAAQISRFNVTGSFFRCKESSDEFQIQIGDAGEWLPMEAGLSFHLTGGDTFDKIWLRNNTGAAITFEFYAGAAEVDDARLNTPPTTTATFYQQNPSTTAAGSGVLSLAGGATSASYAGTSGGKPRKQFLVANLDAVATLYITNSGGTILGAVGPASSWTLETNADLKVNNPSGSPVNYIAGSTFYA